MIQHNMEMNVLVMNRNIFIEKIKMAPLLAFILKLLRVTTGKKIFLKLQEKYLQKCLSFLS